MFPFVRPMNIHPPGGGCDNTPNSVNWTTAGVVDQGPGGYDYYAVVQQITGITCEITLKAEYTRTNIKLFYKVSANGALALFFNDENGVGASYLTSNGWTYLAPDGTFNVNNNEYVYFVPGYDSSIIAENRTVTIKNNSDGGATLDTFVIDGN